MTRRIEERRRTPLGLGVSCLLTGSWVFSWVLEISWAGHCSLEASSLDKCSSSVLCACSRALLPIARTMIDRSDAWWPSSDLDWGDFYVLVPWDFVFSVLIRVFIDVHSQFCPVYCPSDYGIMTHRLPLRLWVHDSQIAPRIMRLCPTDCPSDYEFMTHRLSLGLWDHIPRIVPRLWDAQCFQMILFSSTFITISGTWFLLSPRFMEIEFLVLWHLCVLSWYVRCLTPLWVPLRMAWLD